MANEAGHYFRDIYKDLVKRLPTFPSDDPSPNLQECLQGHYQAKLNGTPVGEEHGYVNFVRAEMLAKQRNLPSEVIIHIQEMTVLQYVIDYGNEEGLAKVMHLYKMTPMELDRIGELIKQEEYYPCFSFSLLTEREGISVNWDKYYLQRIKGTKDWYNRFYG